jgi:hypothetical protein
MLSNDGFFDGFELYLYCVGFIQLSDGSTLKEVMQSSVSESQTKGLTYHFLLFSASGLLLKFYCFTSGKMYKFLLKCLSLSFETTLYKNAQYTCSQSLLSNNLFLDNGWCTIAERNRNSIVNGWYNRFNKDAYSRLLLGQLGFLMQKSYWPVN